jgi:L,D-transpeptidase ErfK/SrfK
MDGGAADIHGVMTRTTVALTLLVLACASAVYAQPLTGDVRTIRVNAGETLRVLGSRWGIDPRILAAANGLAPDVRLRAGDTLTIDNRHILPPLTAGTSIVVNVPQRMLFVTFDGGIAAYPVAVGRSGWQTPLGTFSIVSRETNPTWDVPESIREEARRAGRALPLKVPPGPDNPLGDYWLGLSVGGIGIHGTNAPTSVYQVVTHGCIRMHADDVADLFGRVQVGARGEIVYEPLLVAAAGGDVFLEAHRDVYGRGPDDPMRIVDGRARELGLWERVDWDAAARVLQERAGVARVVTRR